MDQMQRNDPAAWREYLSELHAFDVGTTRDGLTAAASDWPEYNDARKPDGCPTKPVTCCSPTLIRWRATSKAGRAVLVLSGRSYNELRNEQLIVAAITSRQRGLTFHIPVGAGGLRMPSWVQSESVRAISVQRVIRQLGRASPETVAEVRNRVINFLRDW